MLVKTENLTALIEDKRNEMYEAAQRFGYCSPQVVAASVALDSLIAQRMRGRS